MDSNANNQKSKDKRKREIMFCPICGSLEVDWVGGLYILSPHMECKGCGYRGAFIEGDLEFAKKIREEYLEKKRASESSAAS